MDKRIEVIDMKNGFKAGKIKVPSNMRFSSEKGCISLLPPCYVSGNTYELYCVEGSFFDDIERYEIEDEMIKRVEELLL